MKWETFFTNLKSAWNAKFGTEMSDDTSPTEALDIINAIEVGEVSEQNAESITELTERMARHEAAMQLLDGKLDAMTEQLTELQGNQVTESQLDEINTTITGLEEQVNKVKMSYTNSGKVIQETSKAGQEAPVTKTKNGMTVGLSLSEILTGQIKN